MTTRRSITLAIILLLITSALAGCLGASDDAVDAADADDASTTTPTSTTASAVMQVALDDCEEVAGAWVMDDDELRPHLPPGFEPAGAPGGEAGVLQLITATCTLTPPNGSDADPRDVSIATAWIMVDPPAEYTVDGVGAYLIAPWTVVTDAGAASTFSDWGLEVVEGDVGFGAPVSGPPAQVDEVTASDGDFSLTLSATVPSRETNPNHPIFRAFLVNEGEVMGAMDIDGGSHPHWEIGGSHLETSGPAPFPAPDAPGIAIHGFEGQLHFSYVPQGELGEPVLG